jgi:biotin--protein ligase
MEDTAACIVSQFEKMWTIFVNERGSFDRFMDLYLERWLHSYVLPFPLITKVLSDCRDQLVTITTVNPPQIVRIAGITKDHGLLRTVPERTGWSSGASEFIDLQPDGNSFDLMSGMIKTKS